MTRSQKCTTCGATLICAGERWICPRPQCPGTVTNAARVTNTVTEGATPGGDRAGTPTQQRHVIQTYTPERAGCPARARDSEDSKTRAEPGSLARKQAAPGAVS